MVKLRVWISSEKTTQEKSQFLEFGLASPVKAVKKHVSEVTSVPMENLAVVYCGRPFTEDAVLGSFLGIGEGSTVHVMEKMPSNSNDSEATRSDRSGEIEAVVTSMQTAIMDPRHRILLFNILSNSDGFSSLISATPGLKEDTVAQGVLKDPFLVMHWLRDENAEELIRNHPCLLDACQQIMFSLHAAAGQSSVEAEGLPYDDDDEEGGSDDEENPDDQQVHNPPAPITPQQLAAALAAAAPGAAHNPPAAQPRGQPQQQPQAQGFTPAMFQQAMAQALGPPPRRAQPPQPTLQNFDSAISQLQDMGFTENRENMQALQATGGNFEAALEYIINQRERRDREMGLD